MSGGITDLASFAGGTPLGGSSGLGSLGGLAAANPYLAAGSAILSAFSSPSTNISGAKNENVSGQGGFNPKNKISGAGSIIDLDNPLQIVMLGAGLVVVIYAYKKFKR